MSALEAMSTHTGHWPGRAPRDSEWRERKVPSTECQRKTALWNELGTGEPLVLGSTGPGES